MAVLPYSNTSCNYGAAGQITGNTSANCTIQPSVKTILDLARECDQHVVRLYFLPTPGTNGFTTTHTLVRNDTRIPAPSTLATSTASAITSVVNTTSSSSQAGVHGGQGPPGKQRRRRICHLTRVSESERGVVHLARLHISSMIVATSSITFLSHLVSLRLQGNRLTDLPDQIFRLPSLRELDVSQNRLTALSGLIGMLGPTLEELFLQSNQLQSLPQQLGQLARLRLLDIADNQLGCIPVEVQRLVSESLLSERMLRRVSQAGMGIDNRGEGSSAPPTPLESPIAMHGLGGQGAGLLNAGSNEDGGHDDDDYVQIRQGMKCWARGNRFWQVGAPRSTVSLSPSGLVPSLAGSSSATPTIRPTEAVLTPHASFLHAGASFSALPFQPLGPSLLSLPSPTRTNSGNIDTNPAPPTYHSYHHHSPHNHSHQEPLHYPAHPADHRGYSKDSYTSCSWTLSLSDICSQIVGENLNKDPHYFCHSGSCPHKRATRITNGKAGPPTSPEATSFRAYSMDSAMGESEADKMGECMAFMIPDWMVEQLGLHQLAEMRKSLESSISEDELSGLDELDGHEDIYPDSYQDSNTRAQDYPLPSNHRHRGRRGRRHSLKDPTIPMSLTLVEKEMGCEFCSVCQKRLYFPGLRWKGVGVMDERIVPLEWVACSVQCRAQAEREEQQRKTNNGKAAAAAASLAAGMASLTSTSTPTPTTSTLGVTPITEEDPSGDSGSEEQEYFGGSHHPRTMFDRGPRPEESQATLLGTPTTRARSGTHHHDSPSTSVAAFASSPSSSQATSLAEITSRVGGLVMGGAGEGEGGANGQAGNRAGLSPIVVDHSRTREISMVQHHQQQLILQQQLQLQQQKLQLQQQQRQQRHHQQQQRNYRETIAYGLIKSKALRRRTRALSL